MTHDLNASTIMMAGHGGDQIEAYLAVPTDVAQHGSIVVIHHLPGYDEATKEIVRRFAANGYAALMPNLYYRESPGADPDDAAAVARHNGGVPDDRLVGDVEGAMNLLKALPTSNGKVASIGYCSGGRQSFLAGCRLPFEGVIDCYGAFVVGTPPTEFPLRVTPVVGEASGITGEVLGLFGAEDKFPEPAQVDELAEALRAAGKTFTFRTYENAGHAFFSPNRPSYRVEAANEGWQEIFTFLARTVG